MPVYTFNRYDIYYFNGSYCNIDDYK